MARTRPPRRPVNVLVVLAVLAGLVLPAGQAAGASAAAATSPRRAPSSKAPSKPAVKPTAPAPSEELAALRQARKRGHRVEVIG
jgi:hypothetical protein